MEYLEYITAKKELSDKFYQIIEDENHQDITSLLNLNNENDFKLILHMISNLSNYYYSKCHSKITHFILHNSDYIKQNFTNTEIFNIFQNNKRILLFLIEQKIIEVDFVISMLILTKDENRNFYIKYFSNFDLTIRNDAKQYFNQRSSFKSYIYYFFPEIKPFLVPNCVNQIQQELKKHENFDINRKIGQNEIQLCRIIRKDSIDEFIIYVNQNNLSLSMKIQKSIFETNPLLLKNQTTLIEYAAFFGSIQIFKYLILNGINLTSSLWIYAIHGNNPEIINILEENKIIPNDSTYFECLKESIKCHHNDMAYYFLDNFIDKNIDVSEKNFFNNMVCFGFRYHNYEFIQNFTNFKFISFYACKYDHFEIVKLLLSTNKIDINQVII